MVQVIYKSKFRIALQLHDFEQLPKLHRGATPLSRSTSEQAAYRLLRLFYKKSERTHSTAPPFQPRFALLDSRLRKENIQLVHALQKKGTGLPVSFLFVPFAKGKRGCCGGMIEIEGKNPDGSPPHPFPPKPMNLHCMFASGGPDEQCRENRT